MGVGGQRHAPAAVPPWKTRHPLYRRLSGPHGRYGRVRNISPPPGFDFRVVQPVASRHTDCAIPTHGLMPVVSIMYLAGFFCYFSFVMLSYVQHLVQLECASDISVRHRRGMASYIWSRHYGFFYRMLRGGLFYILRNLHWKYSTVLPKA